MPDISYNMMLFWVITFNVALIIICIKYFLFWFFCLFSNWCLAHKIFCEMMWKVKKTNKKLVKYKKIIKNLLNYRTNRRRVKPKKPTFMLYKIIYFTIFFLILPYIFFKECAYLLQRKYYKEVAFWLIIYTIFQEILLIFIGITMEIFLYLCIFGIITFIIGVYLSLLFFYITSKENNKNN